MSAQEPAVHHSMDPALDINNQHHHPHIHHSAAAAPDEKHSPSYVTGTQLETVIPTSGDSYHRGSRDYKTGEKGEKGAPPAISDEEHGHSTSLSSEEEKKQSVVGYYYAKFKWVVHLAIWILFTVWFGVGVGLHRRLGWVVPFLLYLCISLRIFFFYVPSSAVMKPIKYIYNATCVRGTELIPENLRLWVGGLGTLAVIVIGTFASPTSPGNGLASRAQSLFGLLVFLLVLTATSRNIRRINWQTVIVGMLLQFLIALFVLRTSVGYNIFHFISGLANDLLGMAGLGLAFLTTDDIVAKNHFFLLSVLPAIIFFVSLVQLLFYYGILQWFIGKFAVFFFWSMRVSGAEAVVAAASPFIGQGESAMLIRPFIAHLTTAEIHQIMCSGFATIAGSVLVAYIGMGVNGQALISSCVMSVPASLAVSKLRYPETEETLTAGRVVIPDDDEHKAANGLHAFAEGAWLGLKIAGMIMATLLCIIALLGLFNGLLTWWGHYFGIKELNIQLVVGYLCYPVAWLLGVPKPDLYSVAELIGTKLMVNEFVAYTNLKTLEPYKSMEPRSQLIVTFALCGFANIGSLGTQIGVLSQISPSRGGDVSRVAVSALLTGAISTLTSASIAGMLVEHPEKYLS